MNRRHFLRHLATGAALVPTVEFISHVQANAQTVKRNQKACILIWLGGGAPTIDMWDLKPGSNNGGEFTPIATNGDMQICEHLPKTAMVMDELSIVRSMSTREADHTRGRYYLHTAFVPNPTVIHPTFGSVVSHELGPNREELEIPSFVSIGGPSGSPGYLGMSHAPFVVDRSGRIRNANSSKLEKWRMDQRLQMLSVIEGRFINSKRGDSPTAHKDVYKNAVNLMSSKQTQAFKVDEEKSETRDAYGRQGFGNSLLMARRLVETGVPFVEVTFPRNWDLHTGVFTALRDQHLPEFDAGVSALVADLKERGLLESTSIVCMGEFGRTPRINANSGRDHWASSWSVLMGGGGLKTGQAVGATDADGIQVVGKSYQPGDVWATVAHSLGIPRDIVHTSKRGRPMSIANGGTPIKALIG